MGYVQTLEAVTPGRRHDGQPWRYADIYEAASLSGPFVQIDSKELSPVDTDPLHPAVRNFTTSNAAHQRGFYRIIFRDAASGTQATDIIGPSDNLLTLDEYRLLTGVNPTMTKDDARIRALLRPASRAVRQFTDRKFELASEPSARTYQYDGSGFLDVDDFTSLVSIETDGGYTGGQTYELSPNEYTAMPPRETTDDDPHYYINLHSMPGSYSPEMGFTRNLDTMDVVQRPVMVTVTATWGWPSIPEDVKLATAWTVQDVLNKPSAGDLQAEAIAGFSRTWQQAAAGMNLALPNRARDILVNYARPF